MKKFLFLIPLVLLADVNPFNAGNLNSPNPYGLTPQEKVILQNKKDISKNSKLINKLEKNINDLNSTLIQKFVQYDQTISDLSNKLSSFSTILSEIDATQMSIEKIKKQLKDANLTQIKQQLNDLNSSLSDLKNKYKNQQIEYQALKNSIEAMAKVNNQNYQYLYKSLQTIVTQLKQLNKPVQLSPNTAFDKAKKYFFSDKLNKAAEYFSYSLNHNHLPATSSYYLGEIAYKKGNYKNALAFYKKSITLYPKTTSFTDRLLYHTAVSFMKLHQVSNAKLTFEKLIADFPKSRYADLAKKELEKLH